MIDLNGVDLENINFEAQGNEDILQNLKVLLTTPIGSVPFDRDFGIDFGIIDNPVPIARGKLIVEYTDKIKRYEPRARIKEVNFIPSVENGTLIPKVVIEIEPNTK